MRPRPYIRAAAYMEKDSKAVYVGRTHIEADANNIPKIAEPRTYVPGFLLNSGRFVNRKQAAKIAFAAGQIKKKKVVLKDEDLQ